MTKKIRVNLQNHEFHGEFPDLCVYCGAAKETQQTSILTKQEKTSNQSVYHKIELHIPYCEEHATIARRNKKVVNVLIGIGIGFALLAAILAFTYVSRNGMFGVKEGAGLFVFGLLTVVATAYFTFMLIFQVLRLITNVLMRKFTGYPVDDPLGVSFTISQNTNTIDLFFSNVEFGDKFKEINIALIDQDIS